MSIFRSDNKRNAAAYQQELYNLHYRRIYNTCLRIIGNPMDAEEAMHDTFLKLFEHMDELKDEKAFYSWSRQIAIRTSIDRVRKTQIFFEPIDDLIVPDNDDSDDEEMELSVDAIKKELNNLPDGYRIIISMRLFEEYDFKDIARLLRIKESTARSQFIRGREKLAGLLRASIGLPNLSR